MVEFLDGLAWLILVAGALAVAGVFIWFLLILWRLEHRAAVGFLVVLVAVWAYAWAAMRLTGV